MCLALAPSLPALAAKSGERAKQKAQAEAQRAELQQKLAQLKHEIDDTEEAKSQASDALAESEAAISHADRSLHDLEQEQAVIEAKLAKIVKQQEELRKTVELQQQKLARLLRDQYVKGNEDRMKLLLSGDDPNRINRELQLLGYVSQAQAKLIASLRANLAALEANKAATEEAKEELDDIADERLQQKQVLEREKVQRSQLLAKLSSKLAAQRKEAGNVEQNEHRLGGLVDKLSKLIEEQQKAEAAAAERRRKEEAARKAEAERRSAAKAAKLAKVPSSVEPKQPNPDAIDADEPPASNPAKAPTRIESTPIARLEDNAGVFPRDFEALRGQLRLPVRGDLVTRFGSRRGDGPSWKGVFIKTEEGAEVKAIAGGRVVFAEWLRGFGNLIIVDHGNQYMSIYGNNQAVLKHAGDVVKTGEVIANAGNSGGNEQSGLYFEMRHQGRAFDPMGWVSLK
ncbi:MAG TPA: peptidoglycan DD-metalloendopeptidase family protein [Burkholderiaceae bacterium]